VSDWIRAYKATAEFFDRKLAASSVRVIHIKERFKPFSHAEPVFKTQFGGLAPFTISMELTRN
jgi:hypothetical protein